MKYLKYLFLIITSLNIVACANFDSDYDDVAEENTENITTLKANTDKSIKPNRKAIVKPLPKSSLDKPGNGKLLNKDNIKIGYKEQGYASFYHDKFHGRKTANGGIYNKVEYTAAHRSAPIPSVFEVVNLKNQRSVLVVITDRGPYHNVDGDKRRIIDLSPQAAKALDMINDGIALVEVKYLHEETLALAEKFPQKKKVNLALQSALTKYVAHVNARKIGNS